MQFHPIKGDQLIIEKRKITAITPSTSTLLLHLISYCIPALALMAILIITTISFLWENYKSLTDKRWKRKCPFPLPFRSRTAGYCLVNKIVNFVISCRWLGETENEMRKYTERGKEEIGRGNDARNVLRIKGARSGPERFKATQARRKRGRKGLNAGRRWRTREHLFQIPGR